MQVIELSTKQMENGKHKVTYNGRILGDSNSFDSAEQALASVAHKDGQLDGRWEGSTWVDTVYKIAE